jgi:maleamate amidohydrolase
MDDLDVHARQGFGGRVGMGRRPALLIVDLVNGLADPALFGGGNIAAEIARARPVVSSPGL